MRETMQGFKLGLSSQRTIDRIAYHACHLPAQYKPNVKIHLRHKEYFGRPEIRGRKGRVRACKEDFQDTRAVERGATLMLSMYMHRHTLIPPQLKPVLGAVNCVSVSLSQSRRNQNPGHRCDCRRLGMMTANATCSSLRFVYVFVRYSCLAAMVPPNATEDARGQVM